MRVSRTKPAFLSAENDVQYMVIRYVKYKEILSEEKQYHLLRQKIQCTFMYRHNICAYRTMEINGYFGKLLTRQKLYIVSLGELSSKEGGEGDWQSAAAF